MTTNNNKKPNRDDTPLDALVSPVSPATSTFGYSDAVMGEMRLCDNDYDPHIDPKASQEIISSKDDNNSSSELAIRDQKEVQRDIAQTKDDFATARDNITEVVSRGSEILDAMIDFAKDSESPRAYEVVANLMKTISDVNQDLASLHEKRAKALSSIVPAESGASSNNDGTNNNTQNNFFVGSAAELQRALRLNAEKDLSEAK